jgi:two-component system, sensor histidine kinase ChiS
MEHNAATTLLVVDDNVDNADLLRDYLTSRGYHVVVAHGGDEALAQFEQTRPALVLLDIMMPGRSGWDVCRLMKQHAEHGKNVRVIMVTALKEWDDKQSALQQGADDYLTKPIDFKDLNARVERNLALLGAER